MGEKRDAPERGEICPLLASVLAAVGFGVLAVFGGFGGVIGPDSSTGAQYQYWKVIHLPPNRVGEESQGHDHGQPARSRGAPGSQGRGRSLPVIRA